MTLLLALLDTVRAALKGTRTLVAENLALRQQLAIYKRTRKRPKLRTSDRVLWAHVAVGDGP